MWSWVRERVRTEQRKARQVLVSEWREFCGDRSRVIRVLILIFAFYGLVGVRVHDLGNHAGVWSEDEYHTVTVGRQLLEKGKIGNFRVPEGSRWVFRALYPLALIRMNQVLGGDHLTQGWEFPGPKYLDRHPPQGGVISDPSVQDFYQTLRLGSVFLLFLSFLPLLGELFKRGRLRTAFWVVAIAAGSELLLREQRIFYVETIQLAALNLLLALALSVLRRQRTGWGPVLGLAFLYAFAVATKLSALFMAVVPIHALLATVPASRAREGFLRTLGFVAASVLFFGLINAPAFLSADALGLFIQDTTSNFWHYAVGHERMESTGPGHWLSMIEMYRSTFGYATVLLPAVFGLGYLAARERAKGKGEPGFLAALGIALALTGFALSVQRIHLDRNLLPWIVSLTLLAGLCWEEASRSLQGKMGKRVLAGIGALLFLGGVYQSAGPGYLYKFFLFDPQHSPRATLVSLRASGEMKHLTQVGCAFEGFDPSRSREEVPLLTHGTFSTYEKRWFESFERGEVVAVRRTGRNFQLTNFILPQAFRKFERFGSLFIFHDPDPVFLARFKPPVRPTGFEPELAPRGPVTGPHAMFLPAEGMRTYRLRIAGVEAGTIRMQVEPKLSAHGKDFYRITAELSTAPLIQHLLKLEAKLSTLVDGTSGLPTLHQMTLARGLTHSTYFQVLDQRTERATMDRVRTYADGGEEESRETWSTPRGCQTILSAFYALRSLDFDRASLPPLTISDNGRTYTLNLETVGKQSLALSQGTFEAMVLRLRAWEGETPVDLGGTRLWVGRQGPHDLLRAEFPLKVGQAVLEWDGSGRSGW